jgi:BTB/POZ domain-containing protein KCTD9
MRHKKLFLSFIKIIFRFFILICQGQITVSLFFLILVGTIILIKIPNDKIIINGLIDSALLSIFLNIVIFGVLINLLNLLGIRRSDIKRWNEEIDNYREWKEKEAMFRIVGNIRRLNKIGYSKINLHGCYLEGANLANVNLNGAIFGYVSFGNANLSNSSLKRVFFSETGFGNTDLQNANLEKSYGGSMGCGAAFFVNAKLEKAILNGISFCGGRFSKSSMHLCSIVKAYFNGTEFIASNMENVNLSGTIFDQAYISECKLQYSKFVGCIFKSEVIKPRHSAEYVTINKIINSDLTGADFRDADIKNVLFEGSILSRCNFLTTRNLSADQLGKAKTLYGAIMDPDIEKQIKDRYPLLLDEPLI